MKSIKRQAFELWPSPKEIVFFVRVKSTAYNRKLFKRCIWEEVKGGYIGAKKQKKGSNHSTETLLSSGGGGRI